jgi:hypothetical protein
MPNKPLLGIHFWPSRKDLAPIFKIKGIPSSKMKKVIRDSIKMDERAIKKKAFSTIFSCSPMVVPS